jgi:hypothetical protein
MGRPLKQKFFDPVEGSVNFGGESLSSLSFSDRGEGYFANVAIAIGAPNLPGGVQATVGSITRFGNGAISGYTVTNAGSGYTTAPSVTITEANTTPAVATAVLTSAVTNVIATSAWIPAANGGSSAVIGDIVKQVGARRYKVRTAQGTGKCKLVTTTPTVGTMTIAATDSLGSTYYVKKLEENLVTLIQNTDGGSGFEFGEGERARWSLAAATTGIVQVASN